MKICSTRPGRIIARGFPLRAENVAVDTQEAENHLNHILGPDGDYDDEPAVPAAAAPALARGAPAPASAYADPGAAAAAGQATGKA